MTPRPLRCHAATPALFCLLLLCAPGCGKKGPPLPPLSSYPERIAHVGMRQIGDRLVLSFPRPQSRTDGAPLAPDAAIEILMTTRDPAPKHVGEIETSPDIRWSVPRADWDAYTQGRRMEVPLRLGGIVSGLELPQGEAALKGKRLSFIVQVVEAKRKRSLPSDIETFTICDPPPAPTLSAGRILEDGLLVSWSAGGPSGAGGAKFSLYRQEEGQTRPDTPLTAAPLDALSYLDLATMPGRSYRYTVRATAGVDRCESADSPMVTATRVDLFPPSPPQGLAAVSEKTAGRSAVRLFWRPNREPDLHGYRVYRATGAEGAWKALTSEDLTATSYTDADVTPGVVYSYAVTARDGAVPPNESLFSDPATEKTESGQ